MLSPVKPNKEQQLSVHHRQMKSSEGKSSGRCWFGKTIGWGNVVSTGQYRSDYLIKYYHQHWGILSLIKSLQCWKPHICTSLNDFLKVLDWDPQKSAFNWESNVLHRRVQKWGQKHCSGMISRRFTIVNLKTDVSSTTLYWYQFYQKHTLFI